MTTKKKKVAVFILFTPVFLLAFAILALEGTYYYQVAQIKPEKITVETKHSKIAIDSYLASLKEKKWAELESFSATEFLFRLFLAGSFYDYEEFHRILPAGIAVTSQMARSIAFKRSNRGNSGDWHLNNIVLSIWVSRNYTSQEAINYQLDTAYFGKNQIGMQKAANFYFSTTSQKLNANQLMSLIAMPLSLIHI